MTILVFDDDNDDAANPPRPPRKFRGPTNAERFADNAAGDPTGPRQTLVVSNAAVRLTPPPNATSATVSIDANPVRYTVDGTTPTAAVGTTVGAGAQLEVMGRASLLGLQLIRSGAADATAQVEYFN